VGSKARMVRVDVDRSLDPLLTSKEEQEDQHVGVVRLEVEA